MDFAHILIWITVGLVAAIGAGYVAVAIRNARNPSDAPEDSQEILLKNVIDEALTKYESTTKSDLSEQTNIVKQAITDSAERSKGD